MGFNLKQNAVLPGLALLATSALAACGGANSARPSALGGVVSAPQEGEETGAGEPVGHVVFSPSRIQFEEGVTTSQRKLIEFDLAQLSSGALRAIEAQDSKLGKVLGVSRVDNESLLGWLEERVRFIVPGSFDVRRSQTLVSSRYAYPNEGVRTGEGFSSRSESPFNSESDVKVMMTNVGAFAYLLDKEEGALYSINLGSLGQLNVTTPRIGIIQIGEGLFAEDYGTLFKKPWGMVSVINRLSTFFHEARHSDGNGNSLSFTHATCPSGHTYEGHAACDRNLNGPYVIGALVIGSLERSCTGCSVAEHELLRLLRIDSLNRVINTQDLETTAWDATPEGVVQ